MNVWRRNGVVVLLDTFPLSSAFDYAGWYVILSSIDKRIFSLSRHVNGIRYQSFFFILSDVIKSFIKSSSIFISFPAWKKFQLQRMLWNTYEGSPHPLILFQKSDFNYVVPQKCEQYLHFTMNIPSVLSF